MVLERCRLLLLTDGGCFCLDELLQLARTIDARGLLRGARRGTSTQPGELTDPQALLLVLRFDHDVVTNEFLLDEAGGERRGVVGRRRVAVQLAAR